MRQLGAEIVIATDNAGKVKEFERLFGQQGITVKSLRDYADLPDIVEDGATFADNAWIKASAIARVLGVPVVADDSGLCVDRLGGEPGVHSARYSGTHGDDAANNRKLLEELHKLGEAEERSEQGVTLLSPARFVCAMALSDAQGQKLAQVEGRCEGYIIAEPRGEGGFGYDPLFYLPEQGKTMAELSMEDKNKLSHRAKAMAELMKALSESY